jgi:glycosyltransferase involved in cell wall biosynthesis
MEKLPVFAFIWPPSRTLGWGQVAIHAGMDMIERGTAPLFLAEAGAAIMEADQWSRIGPAMAASEGLRTALSQMMSQGQCVTLDGVAVLHPLGDHMQAHAISGLLRGRPNLSLPCFCDEILDEAALDSLNRFDRHIVLCGYNRDLLADHGIHNTTLTIQGIDPVMRPGPRRGRFAGRFAIYSGGKLEYRKGQDIVVAAFKAFHSRHPEALLVTAWRSPFVGSAASLIEGGLVVQAPGTGPDGGLDLAGWLAANGIGPDDSLDLGMVGHADLREVLIECDVAIFPNRSEPATNLMAMEAMACGLPTAVSANTGHTDILDLGDCLPFTDQRPVAGAHRARWGESSVDEIVAVMEQVYRDRDGAAAMGLAGSRTIISRWTWSGFVDGLCEAVSAAS